MSLLNTKHTSVDYLQSYFKLNTQANHQRFPTPVINRNMLFRVLWHHMKKLMMFLSKKEANKTAMNEYEEICFQFN